MPWRKPHSPYIAKELIRFRDITFAIVLVSQFALLLIFTGFKTKGFPLPSLTDIIVVATLPLLYLASLATGLAIAVYARSLKHVALAIAIPACCAYGVYSINPRNRVLSPKDYQHLIGKKRGEIQPLLYPFGSRGYTTSKVEGVEVEHVHYNGIDLIYRSVYIESRRADKEDLLIDVVKSDSD